MKKTGNRKAALLTVCCFAAGCFSGCAQQVSESKTASLIGSSVESTVSSSSEKEGAPEIVAPHFYDVDLSSVSVTTSEESTDNSQISADIHEDDSVEKTVQSGEEFVIAEGETYTVDEGSRLVCESGGRITVLPNAEFIVNGSVQLDGEMELSGGGYLGIGKDAAVDGSGSLKVLDSFDDIDCEGSCKVKITPPDPVDDNGCTRVGGVLIANKRYSLPEDYAPGLEDEVVEALEEMRLDSGYAYEIVSGFRDYDSQMRNFDWWCEQDGYDAAITYSAPPGHSEHQTGLTMDLDSLEESYGKTPEGIWLAENCHKYGFIIRYPEGKENITGYTYEPWHVRYLGKSTAKLVFDSGLTLEEFLDVSGVL